jgi:hypothetical protein
VFYFLTRPRNGRFWAAWASSITEGEGEEEEEKEEEGE